MVQQIKSSAQRLALLAVGGSVDSLSKRKKLKARKLPKNAPRTHRQVHAVLGGVSDCKSPCLHKASTTELTKLLHVPLRFSTDKYPDLPKH